MLSAMVLNARTTCRVGSASTHWPSPFSRRWSTGTVFSVSCVPRGRTDLPVVGTVLLAADDDPMSAVTTVQQCVCRRPTSRRRELW